MSSLASSWTSPPAQAMIDDESQDAGHVDSPTGQLAHRLREMREQAGLSLRALAEQSGVAHATIREAEEGGNPRVSTVTALLRVLPELRPATVLDAPPGLPDTWASVWRFHRDLHGLVIGRLTVTLRNDGQGTLAMLQEARGVAWLGGDLRDAAIRLAVWRTVMGGSAAALARVVASPADLTGHVQTIDDGSVRHELGVEERGGLLTLTSRRTALDLSPSDAGCPPGWLAGTSHSVEHPVQELVLRVRRSAEEAPGDGVARLGAWPAPLSLDEPWMDLAPRVHPAARLRERGSSLTAIVRQPLIGLRVGVGWSPPHEPRARRGAGRSPRQAPGVSATPRVIRLARERAGLSQRELARQLSVSPTTVAAAEAGQDLRLTLLRDFVAALPGIDPDELFDRPPSTAPCTHAEAWEALRELHGCEVERDTKLIVLSEEGDSALTISTRRLRALRPLTQPLRVRLGLARSVLQLSKAQLRQLDLAGHAAQSVRITAVPGREAHALLTIPAALAGHGVSFSRRLRHPGVYTMTAERARLRLGAEGPFVEGPFVEGTTFAASLPVRRLELIVQFPPGYWPKDITAAAWPVTHVPAEEEAAPFRDLAALGARLVLRERDARVRLTVEQPLIGFKYGLGWELP